MPPPTQYIQANNININNNYVPISNCSDMKLLRPQQQQQQTQQIQQHQQQYKYLDRRSLFPPETKEEYYNGVLRQVSLISLFATCGIRLSVMY